jgi:ribA/ribD-fused uncharacterized protein
MTKHYSLKWLTDSFERGEVLNFIFFWEHTNKYKNEIGKFCFSQWFESPFTIENKTYKTSEHWMMSQKALLFNDKSTYEKILIAKTPKEAKELGKIVLGFDEHIWNAKRFEIVKNGNIHKFNQNLEIAEYLIKTGESVLVEASPVDIIWGVGLSQEDSEIDNIYSWRGLNLLGFALMEVRGFLKEFGHFKPLDNTIQTPWNKFPNIDKYDLFWRMGKGEDYLKFFYEYYNGLNEREKTIIKLTNPAPYDWNEIYE